MWTVALYNSLSWNHHMGGPKRNWLILIECPPDTEIFSKRRKIYTWCVEGMSWWQQVPSAGLNFQDDSSLSLTVSVDVSFETKAQYQLWYLDRVGPDTKLTFTWHRFSAFWLRSKCSICSYQLNICYGDLMQKRQLFPELGQTSQAQFALPRRVRGPGSVPPSGWGISTSFPFGCRCGLILRKKTPLY